MLNYYAIVRDDGRLETECIFVSRADAEAEIEKYIWDIREDMKVKELYVAT